MVGPPYIMLDAHGWTHTAPECPQSARTARTRSRQWMGASPTLRTSHVGMLFHDEASDRSAPSTAHSWRHPHAPQVKRPPRQGRRQDLNLTRPGYSTNSTIIVKDCAQRPRTPDDAVLEHLREAAGRGLRTESRGMSSVLS